MLKFLGDLPPGQRIALFILSDRLHMIQSFTGSSDLLAETARSLMPQASSLFQSGAQQMRATDILGLLPPDMKQGGSGGSFAIDLVDELAKEDFQNGQVRNDTVNRAFRELAQATAVFPGRKNLIWLSESFPLGALTMLQSFHSSAGAPSFMTGLPRDGETSRVISGSQIAVYPISVAGLETGGVGAAMNGTTAAGGNGAALAGGGAVGNNINTVDPETSGGEAAAQPGAQTGGPRLTDTLNQQADA
ncbi:MAG TPA: hypothetical protein VGR96_00480, partial [Acidobacteriaceae bacterium]|nr:hypothetical protein [Acidobacteriaceae bacterium]